jgi:hypothetical protein
MQSRVASEKATSICRLWPSSCHSSQPPCCALLRRRPLLLRDKGGPKIIGQQLQPHPTNSRAATEEGVEAPPHQQRDGAGQQGRGAAPAGNQRDNGLGGDDAAREANKRQGFLVYDPAAAGAVGRLPPPCDVFVKLRGMAAAERLCLPFCTRGFYCNRGTRCNQVHITGFTSLPATSQELLRAFVTSTNGLSFAPGQNPPAGTP